MVLQKVKLLPYDPAISHLGIYPKELKAGSETDIFIPTVKGRNQCPSANEEVDKINIHMMEYYSALERKEIMQYTTT